MEKWVSIRPCKRRDLGNFLSLGVIGRKGIVVWMRIGWDNIYKVFHTQQIGVIFIPFNKDFSLQSTTQEEGISFSGIC